MDRIADYTFIRSLGEGNHGEFYLATPPPRLGIEAEYVAVKVLAPTTSDDAFRRATKELRLFAAVQSPYLVTLFDAGQDGERFYYSLEHCPLGSLASPARPLTRDQVLKAVADGARAAHALHEAGIVHRDIKPANILLHDGGGKLFDLGLAQLVAPGLTVTGMGSLTSVEYMDPNIMRGERASRASDIWALGVTLHRVLTGAGVYGELPEQDPLLALRKVLNTEPTFAEALEPEELALIQGCLQPEPTDRPATAEVFAERVDALARRT